MKLSIISDEISPVLSDSAGIVCQHGFEGIELYAFNGKLVEEMNRDDILAAKEVLRSNDLKVSCFASTLFLVCPLDDTYTAYAVEGWPTFEGNYEKQKETFRKMAEYANLLEAPYLRVFPFKLPRHPGKIDESVIDKLADKFGEIGELAEECGVNVCVETCPHSWGGSGMVLYKMLTRVNHPRLSILWDCGNSFITGKNHKDILPDDIKQISIYEELEQIYPYISHIHLKDFAPRRTEENTTYEHILFGTGCLDYRSLLQRLLLKKYDGYLSLETNLELRGAVLSMENLKMMIGREKNYLRENNLY